MLEVLGTAVDLVCETDVSLLDDGLLRTSVVSLQGEIDRLSACQARQLSEWNSRKLWADDGSKSPASRLARETGLSVTDARHLVQRAKALLSMPLCYSAFVSGELSSSRVDLLVRAGTSELSTAYVRGEAKLLAAICDLSFADASRAVRYWIQLAEEELCENKALHCLEQRSAHCVRSFEGTVDLRALFDSVGGEIFLNQLETIEQELFEADWTKARTVYGDDLRVEHLGRSRTQRRCDALVEMARRSAAKLPNAVSQRALISVLVDYSTFGRVCELASGTVVSPGQFVPILTGSDIERIVFDGPSRIIDVGQRRFFSGALRRAIEVRDRHCQDPSGCEEPAARCNIDHITAYSRGGQTIQTNGRLLCGVHNRAKGAGPP